MCQLGVASGVASEVASASPRNDIPRNDITPENRNKKIMGLPRTYAYPRTY